MKWLSDLLMSPGRSRADRAQDGIRRATDTLALATVEPGHNLLEIEPGRGWFTSLLLEFVGDHGSLVVQQPESLDAFFGRTARKRVERSGKPNARYSASSWETLDADDGSVDRVFWLQGPHEMWFVPQPGLTFGRPSTVFAEIARVLRPGGQLLVIDNLAPAGLDAQAAGELHRSVPAVIEGLADQVGLSLRDEQLDWIGSTADPLDVPTYDPKVHLKTRQYAQVFAR